MPFFRGAQEIDIRGGEFKHVKGNVHEYDHSKHTHYQNSHNTAQATTTGSYNDTSTRSRCRSPPHNATHSMLIPLQVTVPSHHNGEHPSDQRFIVDSRPKEGHYAAIPSPCSTGMKPNYDPSLAQEAKQGIEQHTSKPPFLRKNPGPAPLPITPTAASTWKSNNPFGPFLKMSQPMLKSNDPSPRSQAPQGDKGTERGGNVSSGFE